MAEETLVGIAYILILYSLLLLLLVVVQDQLALMEVWHMHSKNIHIFR